MTVLSDIEEFRLVRLLGRGGMGTVYLAHDTILDRPVALKIVTGVSADSRLRFLTEARAIARLHHPNVVAIHRAGTTADGAPYLIQELIRGQPLDRIPRPVPPSRCLQLATGIARGLAAAHRRGVLHRDVKPSNIMVDELGTPRLLDFGIAKLSGAASELAAPPPPAAPAVAALDDTAELPGGPRTAAPEPSVIVTELSLSGNGEQRGSQATRAGTILGTPRYMAPEAWHGEVATARSDLYALGVVMYELVAGEPPFPETEHEPLRQAVLTAAVPPIDARVAGLDPAFAALIMRCLERDPAARPGAADEVVDQLERIASGAATIPEGNPYRGLAPFEAEQRAVFFGRGSEIAAVVDRLRGEPFVVVAGDSGIGKSSLCRAGVLPAIAAGALGDGRTWTTRTAILGRRPSASLAELLEMPWLAGRADPDPTEPIDASLLASHISQRLALGTTRGLLLFVDQLEELVTLASLADAHAAAEILSVLGEGIPGVKAIVAVRGDFFTRVAALPMLRDIMARSLHLVRGLSPDDARDVVVAPARAKGVAFETIEMVDELAGAIVDRPSALPLLSFALSELWARRDLERAIIPARALTEIGGVAGALASHADRIVTSLAAPERATARRIMLDLVTAEGTRASRARAELVADDPAAARVLETLVRGRLITARDVADGEPVYELAHESLLGAWHTLRGWLDDAAGQRGIRTRLAAAAAEWARLGQRRELLWHRSQLAEVARLGALPPAEQRFVAASRRAARLRTVVAVAIAAAVPAAAAATWLGLALRDERRQADQVAERLEAAARGVASAEATAREARRIRLAAIALFEHADEPPEAFVAATAAQLPWLGALAPIEALPAMPEAGDALWRDGGELFQSARLQLRDAATELETALLAGGNLARVRKAMADAIYRQALIAEEVGDLNAANELEDRLRSYDDGGVYRALWRAPSQVTITSPRAIRIEVSRYVEHGDGSSTLQDPVAGVDGPRLIQPLSRGSYRATVVARDIAPVVVPFIVERGTALALDIPLPPRKVPEGMIYIPAGAFLMGSGDDSMYRTIYLHAPPLHRSTTGAYLISRTEVTFADWLAFLRALPEPERAKRQQQWPRNAPDGVRLDLGAGGRFTLTLQPSSEPFGAREGEVLRYTERSQNAEVRWEKLPVTGVSYDDAVAYAAWLAETDRVPRARLCTEREWERAARGADARLFPHGNRLQPDEANFDLTYGRKTGGMGPDQVGAHPASTSPFGVVDLAGNAFELVVAGTQPMVRGGSFIQGPMTALIVNRSAMNQNARHAYLGFRICADP